jgi:hypothetical protein
MKSTIAGAIIAFASLSEAVTAPNAYSRRILNQANYRHHVKYGMGGSDYIVAHKHTKAQLKQKRGQKLKASEKSLLKNGAVIDIIDGKKFYKIGNKVFDASDPNM